MPWSLRIRKLSADSVGSRRALSPGLRRIRRAGYDPDSMPDRSRSVWGPTLISLLVACNSSPPKPAPTVERSEVDKTALRSLVEAKQAEFVAVGKARDRAWDRYRLTPPSMGDKPCSVGRRTLVETDEPANFAVKNSSTKVAVLSKTSVRTPESTGPTPLDKHDALAGLASRIDSPIYGDDNLESEIQAVPAWPRRYELLLDLDAFSGARTTGKDSFAIGQAVGQLMVWDHEQAQIVCHGPVRASSSASITVYAGLFEDEPNSISVGAALLANLILRGVFDGVDNLVEVPVEQ